MVELSPGINLHLGKNLRLMVHGRFLLTEGGESAIDEAPYKGFWPGEWPGTFADSKSVFFQLAYAD